MSCIKQEKMKINYIKIYEQSRGGYFNININGQIDCERLIPILEDDKLVLKREPFDGDRRSMAVSHNSGDMHVMACGLDLSRMTGERLEPCEYETNEDEIIFWI